MSGPGLKSLFFKKSRETSFEMLLLFFGYSKSFEEVRANCNRDKRKVDIIWISITQLVD